MIHSASVAVVAHPTFGRDGAMFEGLLDFVAQLSVGLWGLVILTAVIRFVGIQMYRRSAARVQTAGPSAVPVAAVPTTTEWTDAVLVPAEPADGELFDALTTGTVANATFDEVRQPTEAPVAVAASVKRPRRVSRIWRSGSRSAAYVPALAAKSAEG